jgi:tetratricopeptide (TPR) repeat protein
MSQSHLQTVSENQHIETPDWKLTPSDVSEAAEENAENLTRLERMLTRAQGFTLGFVRVNVPTQRAELVKQIRERVEPKGIQIIEIDLCEPVEDLLAELVRQLSDQMPHDTRRFAVFVYGLEHSIPSSETYHPPLAVINYKRENFPNAVPAPLVLWVPEYALQAIMVGAPDFWAWRSGLFEFETPKETVETHWLEIEPERDLLELSNMTAEEKQHRIQLLSGLLAEYEGREDADSSEIVRIRLDLMNRIGYIYHYLGDYNHSLEYHRRALKLAQKFNSEEWMARSWLGIGRISYNRGEYEMALQQLNKSLNINEKTKDCAGIARSRYGIGVIYQNRGDYDRALQQFEKSLKMRESIGDGVGVAHALYRIGKLHHLRGAHEKAMKVYGKSLKTAEDIGDRAGVATILHQIGMIYQDYQDYDAALKIYEQSLGIKEEVGSQRYIARSFHQIGAIHQDRGDYESALQHYEKSLKISESIGSPADVAITHSQLGKLFTETDRNPKAFKHLHLAYTTFSELHSPNTKIVVDMLKTLRTQWGAENFDAAWQDATGEAVPETLT